MPLAVRITSPLGRTNTPGAIRIVAQVQQPADSPAVSVQFLVDGTPLAEDTQGPPWTADWVDENPFERRELTVEVHDAAGLSARDSIVLRPFEVAEKAEVASVLLEATVQNKDGEYISGLDASKFVLEEDGVRQRLDVVTPDTLATTYTLLIDSSQSMSRRFDFVREAAGHLMDFLRPSDYVIVAPFSRTLGPITGPTADRRTVFEAISAIKSRGGTAIVDSLLAAANLGSEREGRHSVVLITDGYDEHSGRALDDAIAGLRKADVTVYVVGIGGVAGISLKGERFLRRVAAETGGGVFFPAREQQLAMVHQRVAEDVQRRYMVTYTPMNQKVDGTWRSITLKTTEPSFRVRTRSGYFAPHPPPVRASLEFTIMDTSSAYLDVSADDLEVLEDGVPQKIDAFQEAVTPVSIVFALDTSGSMKPVTDTAKAAAREFVNSLRPEDSLALIPFADHAVFAHDLATNRSWSLDAIDRYTPKGGTALYDAVSDALLRLRGVEGRRVVVVMTDGRDENNRGDAPGSTRTFDQVLALVKSVEASVFVVGLGRNIDRDLLERLARESGGEAYFPDDVGLLATQYQRVLENLRRRYVLAYTSSNSTRDGAWRTVEIRHKRTQAVVRSRGGYFAPAG